MRHGNDMKVQLPMLTDPDARREGAGARFEGVHLRCITKMKAINIENAGVEAARLAMALLLSKPLLKAAGGASLGAAAACWACAAPCAADGCDCKITHFGAPLRAGKGPLRGGKLAGRPPPHTSFFHFLASSMHHAPGRWSRIGPGAFFVFLVWCMRLYRVYSRHVSCDANRHILSRCTPDGTDR